MSTPEDPHVLSEPGPPVPDGAFLVLPQPSTPGEVIPPIPVTFGFGLTNPDTKGHRWTVLRATDGTITADYRIPWQMAEQIGAGIAAGLAQMAQKAQAEEGPRLIMPNGAGPGALLLPDHRANGAGR
jgi:hypothetical protein